MSDELLTADLSGVRTLTLNRPDSFNSLTTSLKNDLLAAVRAASADPAVRAIVITGVGRAFCAGQDLREHAETLKDSTEPFTTVVEHYSPLVLAVLNAPKPVIASVNGMAAGAGAALAYACDLRVAADSARFVSAFAAVGLTADTGMSWTLQRLIGYGRAMELLMLGEPVTAERALAIGLVNRVVPAEDLVAATAALATRMAAGPTSAFARIKEASLSAAALPIADSLAVEARTQAEAGRTTDHRDAVAAFLTKNTPGFTGS